MRKFSLMLLLAVMGVVRGYSQSTYYTFSQQTGTYSAVTSGTAVIASGWDDGTSSFTMPFAFNVMGTTFASGSSVFLSANGYIEFGGTTNYAYTPNTNATAGTYTIGIMAQDLQDNATNGIVVTTVGTAPNRKVYVNWTNCRHYAGTASWNFQMVLYETSYIVEFQFGTNTGTYSSAVAQTGIWGTSGTANNWECRTVAAGAAYTASTSGAVSALCDQTSTLPTSGLVWRYCPTAVCPTVTVSPASGCTPVSFTASGASTYTWLPTTSLSSTNTAATTATPAAVTIYTVTGLAANGCAGTATATANPSTAPAAIAGPTTVCIGVTASVTETTTGGTWTQSGTGVVGLAPYAGGVVVTGTTAGSETLTYTTAGGCATATRSFTVNSSPTVTVSPTSGCTPVTFTASGASTYTWLPIASLSSTNTAATTATPAAITIYTVTGTAANGCTATATATANPSAAPAAIAGPTTVCIGSTASVTETTTGGTWTQSGTGVVGRAPYAGGVVVTGTTAGAETLTYTTAGGCATATRSFTVNALPTVTVSPTSGCTPVTFTASGASTYTWLPITSLSTTNTAATTATPVAVTVYTVTGTDANGCKNTATATSNPTPAAMGGPTAVCTGSTLSITETTTLGTYTQSGTGSLTLGATYAGGKVTTGATVGALTVTYTASAGGCYVTRGITVNALPTVTTSPTSGCTPLSTTASGASTYTWLPITSLSATNTAATTATPVAVTVYTVTGTDANGCKSTATATANPTPAAIGGATSVCVGRTASITEATTGGTWSQSGTGSVTSSAFSGGTVVTGLTPGSVTLTYTPLAGGCYVTRSFTVNANPSLSVTGGGAVYCYGGSALGLTASGSGTSYTWAQPAGGGLSATTGASVTATPTAVSVTYTVTSTDGNGCQTTATVADSTHIPPVYFDTHVGTSICYPGITTYIAMYDATPTYPYGGSYSTSNATVATVNSSGIVTAAGVGTATISYIDGSCGTITNGVTVSGVGITVSLASSLGTYCSSGGPATLTATVSSSPATTDSFLWVASTPATGGLSATLTTSNTVTATPTATNTYTVYATDNSTGCHSPAATVSITYGTPAAISGLTTVCTGANITLTDATGGGTWSGGSGHATVSTFSGTQGVVTGTSAGTASITFTAANGCAVYYTVTVNTTPTISVTPSGTIVACAGTGVVVTASGASSYTWAPATGLSATTGASVTATPTVATTYTVTGTTTGCSATATKAVGSSSATVFGSASASTTTVCPGSTSSLSAAASLTSFSTYTYSNISYNLVSTAGFTTAITGDDANSGAITIPFTFYYFGTGYTTAYVCTNGWVSLNTNSTSLSNYSLPNTGTGLGALIALGMHDMNTGSGTINYGTVGTAPNRKFVVSYNAYGDFSCGGANTTQMILYEGTNVIDINVGSLSGTCLNTVGIQNTAGTVAYTQTSPTINGTTGPIGSLPAASRYTPVPTGTFTYTWSPAGALSASTGTPVNATVASTTTYSVTAAEAGGCTGTFTTTVTTYTLPTVTVTGTGCFAATETAAGAVSYTWSPSAGLSATTGAAVTASPTATTVYTANGTDANGCHNTATKTVQPVLTVTVTPTAGCAPQSMSVSSSTGISYAWAPSTGLSATTGTTVTANPGTAVTYTVTATDAGGCTATANGNVGVPPAAISGATTICALNATTYTNTVTGGSWSTSDGTVATVDATTGIVTGVAAGTCNISYTVGTCTPVYQTINVLNSPTFSVAHTNCAPSASLNVHDTSATVGTDTYTWSPATGLSATTGSSITASPASITTYTVSVSNGTCASADTVRVFPTPASITGTLTVCPGATRSLADASPSGTWFSSSTANATIDATTGVVTGVAAGSTTISYGYTACPSNYATTSVTVLTPPSLSITPSGAVSACAGVGVAITASGASSYTWAAAAGLSATTGATVTANPVSATTYTITGTNAAGCTSTATKLVGVGATAYTATATASPTTVCPGGSTTLTGSASATTVTTYTYSTPSYSLVSTAGFTTATTGDDANSGAITIPFTFYYFGTGYTTAYVCTNGWVSLNTNSTSLSNFALPNTGTGLGALIALGMHDMNTGTGTINYGTIGTAPNRKFVVSYNAYGDFSCGGTNTTQLILYEGTNVIDIMVGSLSGTCANTVGIQNPAGTVAYTQTSPTINGTTGPIGSLPAASRYTPNAGTFTYSWAPSASLSASTGSSVTGTVPSTTTYTVTATEASGCVVTATATVTTYTLPTITVTGTGCFAATETAAGAVSYTWAPSTGLSATTGAAVTASPAATTVYTATGTDSHGCVNTGNKTVQPVLTVTVTPTTGCAPQSLTASSATATSYSWAPSGTLSATTGATVTANPGGFTTYTVTASDAGACTATANATVGNSPASITGTLTACILGTSSLSNTTAGGVWSSSDTTIATVNASTGVVTGLLNGSCTISYTVGTCGSATATFNVLNSPVFTVNPTGCAPSAALNVTTSGSDTYTWAPSTALSGTTGLSVTASPTVTTVYTVTGSNGTCSVSRTSTVYPTVASITGTASVCSGSTRSLADATPGGSWSSSATSFATVDATTGVVTGVAAGSSTISYGYAACPSTAATVSFTVNGTPAMANTSITNCVNSGVATTLSVSGGTSYTWAPATGLSATTGASVLVTTTSAATYTVTGTGTGGCTATVTVPVIISATTGGTVASALPTSTCAGGTSVFTAVGPPTGTYTQSSITYTAVPTTGFTAGPTGDDVNSGAISLPFTFNFYGVNYSSIYICTNGWLSFTTAGTNRFNYALPSTTASGAMGPLIALGMHDMNTGTGTISYGVIGSSPNRKFVVSFNGYGDFSCGGTNSTQAILYETSNIIDINVSSLSGTCANTVGIENAAGTVASTFGTPTINGTTGAIGSLPAANRFSPTAYTYTWSPSTSLSATTGSPVSMTSAPGAGTYTVTATDATTGCFYRGNVTVTTGAITCTVSNPVSVCAGTTGVWTLTSAPSATVYYTINGGATSSVVLDGTGSGTVSQTISVNDTLRLVSVTSGSCSNSLTPGQYVIIPYCVCTPVYYEPSFGTSAATDAMNHVRMGGYGSSSINDSYSPNFSGYLDHTSSVPMDTLQGGSTYSGTLSYNVTALYYANEIWIDYNDDGTFATSEILAPIFGTPAVSVASNTFSVTLPITATVGSHRMRVRNTNCLTTTLEADMLPCPYNNTNFYYYGSCVDYQVYVKAPPPCAGTPTAGTTTASATTGCTGYTSNLALSGSAIASALTYQWQYSFDGTTYFNVTGATTNAYTATVTNVNIYYRCYVYCTNSSTGSNSTPILLHSTPAIGGAITVCQSGTASITDSLSGGTWSSGTPATATIDATTGVVTGVAAGSVTISYATTGCTQTVGINVVAVPASITGTATVCNGFTTTLADAVSLGTWSSANTSIASVDASTGIVTGVGNGSTTISYSNGCGTPATVSYTVNMQPSPIGGPLSICISGGSVTLTDTASGGTWTVSPTTYGTIASTTGVVTPAGTSGTETVTYTRSGCTVTATIGFGSAGPAAITGTTTVCAGSTTALANSVLGGTWSSSNTAVATVDASTGVVTGVNGGTCTITYNNGCGIATTSYTVNGSVVALSLTSGSMTGVQTVCSGGTLTLNSGALSGGTYAWSGPNGFTSTVQNPTLAALTSNSGTYTLTATYGSCPYTVSRALLVDTIPTVTVSASPSKICTGGTSALSVSAVPSTSNYIVNAVPYVLSSITTTLGTATGDDANSGLLTMPFNFNFFGVNYNSLYVCTNGWISFTLNGTSLANATIPSATALTDIGAGVAFGMHDLNTGVSGTITAGWSGTAPNRQVIIYYNGVGEFGGAAGSGVSGQIILHETSNTIEEMITFVNQTTTTHTNTFGIQGAVATQGLTVPNLNGAASTYNIASPQGWRFEKPSYSYTWSPSTALSATTGTSVTATALSTTTTYSATVIDAYSGCTAGGVGSATDTVVAQPTVTVSPSETSLCTGGHMILTATPSGGVGPITGYTWTGPGISSTTGASVTASFHPTAAATTTGAYSVSVAYAGSGCNNAVNSTSSVTINTQPVVTVAPSATSLCSGATLTLTESLTSGGSGTPTYSWSGPGITTTTGTSNVSPSFTPSVSSGSYSVAVSYSDSGCVTANANTGTVTDNALPTVYSVTSGNGCTSTGLAISLSNTQSGVTYYLYLGGVILTGSGTTLSGTGSAASFGTQYTAGTYTVVAVGVGGCTSNMTGSSVITTSPSLYNVTGGNGCTSSCITVGLDNSQPGVSYQLFNGTTGGSTVSGTGSAITFGLKCAAGNYTVVATGSASCSLNMNGSDTVTTSPTAYAVTGGNGCNSSTITVGTSGSQAGVTYRLYINGSLTSSLSGTGSSLSYGAQSAAGVYTVVGTSAAGCQTTMTGADTISSAPISFHMTGGGNYCGVTMLGVGVDTSDVTAVYHLYLNGSEISYTAGTGHPFSFGAFSTVGTYSCVAVGTGSCSTNSSTNVTISNNSVAVTLGASPSICTNATDVFYSYTGATGTPTPNTYSIAWGSSATSAGFTAVPGAGLPSSAVDVAIPTGISAGSYSGTFTISNGICTSPAQTMTINVVAFPTAAITSATAPCMGDASSVVITGTSGATISYRVDTASAVTATLTGGSYSIGTGALTSAHAYELLTVYNPTCTTIKDTTVTITPTPMQWVGGTTGFATDWNTSSNWSCGYVPTSANDVEIPNTANQPVITSGTFSTRSLKLDSSATIAINSGATLNVTGNLTNYSSVTGGGSFVMAGTSAQTMAGTGYLNNLTMNSSSTVSINTGSKVIVNSTLNMSAGTFATNDSLVLNSTDSAHTARVTPISGGTISGQVRMIMTIEGGYRAYRFAGHPFSNSIPLSQLQSYIDITGAGGPANGFDISASNTPSAYWYNTNFANSSLGADPGWRAFTSTSGTPDTNMFHKYEGIRLYDRGAKGEGMGYITTYYPSTHRWGMKGNLNQGTQVVHMVKGTGANEDYNMIANPMPSPVDLGTVMYNAKHDGNIAGNYFFMWNPRLGSTGQFQAQLIGTATPIPYYINQFTCFQVRAAGNYDSLVFHESDKVASVSAWLLKETGEHASFTIYDGNYHAWDMLSIKFNAEAKNAEDVELDARKAKGFDFNFYSISDDNQQLMVDSRPYSAEKTIPLGIASNYEQDMIIKAEEVALPEGGSLYLHDKLLGQYVQMLQGSEYRFTITSDAATQGEQRFELSMKPSAANGMKVSMVPNPASDEVNVNFNTAKAENVSVRVLDMSGVSVFNADLGIQQTGTVKIPVSNFASGIYMVELTSGDHKVVQRLVKE